MALLAQEWTLETDIELASKYEWRGLQLGPGFNTQYAAYGSVAWDDLMLTAGVWSLTDLSSGRRAFRSAGPSRRAPGSKRPSVGPGVKC